MTNNSLKPFQTHFALEILINPLTPVFYVESAFLTRHFALDVSDCGWGEIANCLTITGSRIISQRPRERCKVL